MIRQASAVKTASWLALLASLGYGYFFISLIALHFLRTDYNPVSQTVSQYAIGPYGKVMTAAFYALGISVLALAVGLFQSISPPPRIGSILLGVAATAVVVVGIFPVNRGIGAMPATEYVHDMALMVAFFATIGAMLTLSWRFSQDVRWQFLGRISLAFLLAAIIEFAAFIEVYNTIWIGAVQRAGIATILLWLTIAASRIILVAAREEPSELNAR